MNRARPTSVVRRPSRASSPSPSHEPVEQHAETRAGRHDQRPGVGPGRVQTRRRLDPQHAAEHGQDRARDREPQAATRRDRERADDHRHAGNDQPQGPGGWPEREVRQPADQEERAADDEDDPEHEAGRRRAAVALAARRPRAGARPEVGDAGSAAPAAASGAGGGRSGGGVAEAGHGRRLSGPRRQRDGRRRRLDRIRCGHGDRGQAPGASTSLCSTAHSAACVRDARPSLPRMLLT